MLKNLFVKLLDVTLESNELTGLIDIRHYLTINLKVNDEFTKKISYFDLGMFSLPIGFGLESNDSNYLFVYEYSTHSVDALLNYYATADDSNKDFEEWFITEIFRVNGLELINDRVVNDECPI